MALETKKSLDTSLDCPGFVWIFSIQKPYYQEGN